MEIWTNPLDSPKDGPWLDPLRDEPESTVETHPPRDGP